MQFAGCEAIRMRQHCIGLGGAVEPGSHVVEFGEMGESSDVADTAGMHDGRADIVDELRVDGSSRILVKPWCSRHNGRATWSSHMVELYVEP
jgi:hypothetical protein